MTLKDVANAAKLDVSTVSRALRNEARQSPETRKRVQEIARELGYHPNPLLTTLMANRRRKDNLGAVSIASISCIPEGRTPGRHPWSDQFHEGLRLRSGNLGFRSEIFFLDQYDWSEVKLLKILYSRGVSGLIWWGSSEKRTWPLDELRHFAGVTVGHQYGDYSSVSSDNFENVKLAIQGALAMGYKRPGLVLLGVLAESVIERCVASFLYAESNLPKKKQIPFLNNPERPVYDAWIRRNQPDVIIGNSSHPWCKLPFLALDWLPHLHGQNPFYPGVDVGRKLLGMIAVDLVAAHLYHNERGIGTHARHVYVPGKWVAAK